MPNIRKQGAANPRKGYNPAPERVGINAHSAEKNERICEAHMKFKSRDKKMTELQLDQCRRKLEKSYVVIGIDNKGDLFLGPIRTSKRKAVSYSRLWARDAKYMPYIAVVRCTDIVRED